MSIRSSLILGLLLLAGSASAAGLSSSISPQVGGGIIASGNSASGAGCQNCLTGANNADILLDSSSAFLLAQ